MTVNAGNFYIHTTSYHYWYSDVANPKNYGLGFSYKNWEIGAYKNSLFRPSVYLSYRHELYNVKGVEIGLQYGAITGYYWDNKAVPLPMVVGYIEAFNIRMVAIPDPSLPALGFSIKI